MVDETLAAGPMPASVMALTLKVYLVDGLNFTISTEVVHGSDSDTVISCTESGPITCTVYPMMRPLSPERGIQERTTEFESLWLMINPLGAADGTS